MTTGSEPPLLNDPPGGPRALAIETGVDPQSPLVDLFYKHYDRAFVLPHEKESLQGFRDCLSLNAGEDYDRLRKQYGPFREAILVARDTPGGEVVGGANFIAFELRDGPPVLAINLNYIFVVQAWRRLGYFRLLLDAVRGAAGNLLGPGAAGLINLIFIEQNDPLRMTDQEYENDTAHAGLDQFQRILIWARLGARLIDFPYVQPPLSPAQSPDAALSYAVLGAPAGGLDACLLRQHLLRFFAISVLKGNDPHRDPSAAAQLSALEEYCAAGVRIPLLNLGGLSRDALARFRAPPAKNSCSLREALRNIG